MILQIAPKVFAAYEHLQPGSLTVKVGDKVKAGDGRRQAREHRPVQGPAPALRALEPAGRLHRARLPSVLDRYTLAGTVDIAHVEGDDLVITPESRQVRSAYPLWGGIQNFP